MNTSLLRMRKAIASFTIGTLLASFLAVPAAFAAGTPEWAMEGANAYLKAETRDQGYVLANKCEVATMIANALDLPMGDTEAQRGAEFQDLQGGMAWCQAAAGAVANTGIATGNGDMFGAAGSVSRAVVATMLVRAFQLDAAYQPAALSAERQAEFAGLEWAQEPMALGVAAGIINGDAEGRLLPMEGASKWAVATMLYRAANMGAEEATEEATEETTEEAPATPEVAPTGGALTVSLSDNSPSLDNLGSDGDAAQVIDGATIAVFELAAGSEDVRVSALTIHEIGGNEVFGPIALFDANGMRISREKSFNNDREANVALLNGGLVIPARSSVELYVRASIAAEKGSATAALAIETPDDISSNASSVSVSNATTELARLAQVQVETFEVSAGSASPDVAVGDRDAEVARLEFTAGNADMLMYNITFEQTGTINAESEMANFRLEIEGEEVATTPYSVDDYVSFVLDTPYLVEEDDTIKGRLYADILDGAGDTISFSVESDLDVYVVDQDVKQPAQVTATTLDTDDVTVEAGELSVVGFDASFDEFGKDVSNLVLGYVDIKSDKGEAIELKNINLLITATGDVDTVFDVTTVEAVTSNGTYDLAVSDDTNNDDDCADGGDVDCTFSASNVDLSIEGTQRVWFRVDTIDAGFTADVDVTVSLDSMNGDDSNVDGLYFEEVNNSDPITDITPTSITFEDITSQVSSAVVRSQSQSSSKTVVQGTKGVNVFQFEVEAGDASYIDIDTLTFAGAVDGDADNAADNTDWEAGDHLDSTFVDKFSLYHTSISPENLIDTLGGADIASGLLEVNLDDFRIEASQTTTFILTVDVSDNDDIQDLEFALALDELSVRDSENDTLSTITNNAGNNILTENGTFAQNNDVDFADDDMEVSNRTIAVVGAGTLTVEMDSTDPLSDKDMYVLAGNKAIIASLEVEASNEDITIEDFTVSFDDVVGNLLAEGEITKAINRVNILNEAMEVVATKTVSGTNAANAVFDVTFENENILITEGTQNLYVEIETNQIGEDLAGDETGFDTIITFDVDQARGNSVIADGDVAATTDSNEFGVVSVLIANAELDTQATTLNTNTTAALLRLENSTTTSTQSDSSNVLKTEIDKLTFDISAFSDTDLRNFELNRIGKTAAKIQGYNLEIGVAGDFEINCVAAVAAGDNCEVAINGQVFSAVDGAALDDLITAADANWTAVDAADVVTVTFAAAENVWVAALNATTTTDADESQVSFDVTDLTGDAGVLNPGETAEFRVFADVEKDDNADTDDYLILSMDDLSTANITYSDDDAGTAIEDLRLNVTDLTGLTIN